MRRVDAVQQHVHVYVDDPTRRKEEKRMLKRTKAEDDRRKREEDKVRVLPTCVIEGLPQGVHC
jgi:hypothetical protein